jgi:hypothetical protein
MVAIWATLFCLLAGAVYGALPLMSLSVKTMIVWLLLAVMLALQIQAKVSSPPTTNWRGMTQQSYLGPALFIVILIVATAIANVSQLCHQEANTSEVVHP